MGIKNRRQKRKRRRKRKKGKKRKKSKENEEGVGGREEAEDAFRESKRVYTPEERKGDREGIMNEIVTCCAALR